MKKLVKILTTIVVVILAIALIVPMAFRGKIADIVKKEANAMLAAKLDFERLDISLLRTRRCMRTNSPTGPSTGT